MVARPRNAKGVVSMSTVKVKKPVADFTEGRITGKMIKFALPLMATALLQSFYNAADMMVVGNFAPNGAFAMGAVGACGSLITLFTNFFLGLSAGVGVCVAQNIGAKRLENVKNYVPYEEIFFKSKHPLEIGKYYKVKITRVIGYDLKGEVEDDE